MRLKVLLCFILLCHFSPLSYSMEPYFVLVKVSGSELKSAYSKFDVKGNNSIETWVIATNRWVNNKYNNAAGGRPDFERYEDGTYGVFLLNKCFGFRDVQESSLNAMDNRFEVGVDNSPEVWSRAMDRYAKNISNDIGLPTFEIGANRVRGGHFCDTGSDYWEFKDVSEADLAALEPAFKLNVDNPYDVWFRAANRYARNNGYIVGFPTFEVGANRVRGIHMLRNFEEGSCSGVAVRFVTKDDGNGYWVDCEGKKVGGLTAPVYKF